MAVTYRVNPVSAALAKRLIQVKHVAMVNLLAGHELVPELLQARLAVRRYAVNVNQGIAALHSGAGAPVWLQRAAAGCDRAVDRLDAMTSLLLQHRS